MGAFNRLELPGAFLGPGFKLLFIFNKIGSFVSGLFFPQLRVFNNFSALFSGLFLAIHVVFPCVFNNFSALFFKKRIFLSHSPHFVPKIAAGRHWKKTTMLGQKSQAKSARVSLQSEKFRYAQSRKIRFLW